MILEILVLIVLTFFLAVLFYKQRRKDFQILQMEESQIPEQLQDLLEEEQPLVIRGVSPPRGLTREGLQKIPRLAAFPVGGQPLSSVLTTPGLLSSAAGLPTLSYELREQFAQELAMPVWAQRQWLAPFQATSWSGSFLGSLKTECVLGGLGLHRTTALYTILFPGEGTYLVTILSRESEDLLPANWNYRYVRTFTPNDTPLVADIRYLDIVVRPGTALVIPKHTLISLEPKDPASFSALAIVEYHTPISMLAKSFSQN
jgi:hypothetical protein